MTVQINANELSDALAHVRPMILGHGGDIEIDDVSEAGEVSVRLFGACKACPNMAVTFVGPVRTRFMAVAGVTEVHCEQVNAGPRALARMARLLGAHPFPSDPVVGGDQSIP